MQQKVNSYGNRCRGRTRIMPFRAYILRVHQKHVIILIYWILIIHGLFTSSPKISATTKKLHVQIDQSVPWFNEWNISINTNLTQAIIFSKKQTTNALKIKFRDTQISWSNIAKYLGIQIKNIIKFLKYVKNTTGKAIGEEFALYPLIHSQCHLPLRTKYYI